MSRWVLSSRALVDESISDAAIRTAVMGRAIDYLLE
jgi:hypothetical protein